MVAGGHLLRSTCYWAHTMGSNFRTSDTVSSLGRFNHAIQRNDNWWRNNAICYHFSWILLTFELNSVFVKKKKLTARLVLEVIAITDQRTLFPFLIWSLWVSVSPSSEIRIRRFSAVRVKAFDPSIFVRAKKAWNFHTKQILVIAIAWCVDSTQSIIYNFKGMHNINKIQHKFREKNQTGNLK